MTPERWQQVKSALHEAMLLEGLARAAHLERIGAIDPALRAELDSLLATEEDASSRFLDVPAAAALEEPPAKNRLAGERLGPYQLLEEIGSGGMGEVYRAVRADDEYRQQVAIKLVRAGVDAAFVGERLRAERQILASFEHPHIARLLDGGTTKDGVPYLVMELIDGQPITDYCDQRRLSTSARLKLFLLACSAVRYAHQHMVIHRDLKPSNVLVTAEGAPKLLDFGIAKILERSAIPVRAGMTVNAFRVLTPQYASPEQLRGETVSAASDVYSLGVILYELLTGTTPRHASDRLASDVVKEIFDPEPKKPSTVVRQRAVARRGEQQGRADLAAIPDPTAIPVPVAISDQDRGAEVGEGSPERLRRRLRGDLDTIVLKALRQEPEQRYETVEQLAEDVRRHLEHLPITARRPTLGYRASTFLARHKIGVAASALIVLALASGVAASTREARIAESQRLRAEHHLNDVRTLANAMIFEIHDSIRDLPGAARGRRLLLDTALRYLDGLSEDAASDPVLQGQLAADYERLGDIRGQALDVSEQDYADAARSYRRALALRQATIAAEPGDDDARRDIVQDYRALSDILLWDLNDARDALACAQQALAYSRLLTLAHPTSTRDQVLLATSELRYGHELFTVHGDVSSAATLLGSSIARLQRLRTLEPSELPIARALALAYVRAAEIPEYRRDYSGALKLDLSARSLLLSLIEAQPVDGELRQLEARTEHSAASQLLGRGEYGHAMRYERAALSSLQTLAADPRALAANPRVTELHADLSMTLAGLAEIAARRGQPDRAIALLHRALREAAGAPPAESGSGYFRRAVARAEMRLGEIYVARARDAHRTPRQRREDWRSAREWFGTALATYQMTRGAWFEAAVESERIAGEIERCDHALAATELRQPPEDS